jgi:hypothetical protein
MPEEKQEESEVVEALKLATKIDWKGIALILTALVGAGGAVWNKAEMYFQNYQQRQTAQVQQAATGGAYEAMATRLDELFMRIEALEAKAKVQTEYVPVETVPPPPSALGAGAGAAPDPVEAVAEADETPEPPPDAVAPEPKPEPVSKRFSRARLPEFEAVQQAARQDLEEFIKEVKAK